MSRPSDQRGLDGSLYRMKLGNKPDHGREPSFEWWRNHHETFSRYWPKPLDRFFERLGYRRYRSGPIPWAPGRYNTARWGPYTGCGRFSGIREGVEGAYYAERYTGVRNRPEDYHIGRSSPEWIAADEKARYRRRSWRCEP